MTHRATIPRSASNRTLDVLRDVRARFESVRGHIAAIDLELGEEYADALDQLDAAIVAETAALNAEELAQKENPTFGACETRSGAVQ